MNKVNLRDAIDEFQLAAGDNYWEEYGISDRDAYKGIKLVLDAAGIQYTDDCVFDAGRLSTPEAIAESERRQKQWAEEHPEFSKTLAAMSRYNDDVIKDYVTEVLFNSNKTFTFIRGKK